MTRTLDTTNQRREEVGDPVGAQARDQGDAARPPLGVQRLAEGDRLLGRAVRPELHPERVVDSPEELDVRAFELAGALTDPEQVSRAVVPVTGERIAPGQRLLVAEDQRVVAGP